MSDLKKNLLRSKLPPMVPRSMQKAAPGRSKDYSPVMWSEYFEEKRDVQTDKGTFRIYFSKKPEILQSSAPVICLLHGGGFSALTWCCFVKEITEIVHCQCMCIDFR